MSMPGTAGHAEQPIRLLLVDDHEVVREGLRRILASCDDITIVGEAATGEEALRLIPEVQPTVVLLDLRLPGTQGLDVLAELQSWSDPPEVLILTVHDDEDLVLGAARSGARGYVLKHTSREELTTAVRRVAAGGHYFSEEVISALIRGERRDDAAVPLTEREMDVLSLLGAGLSNKEIGERLYLSPDTVKTHLGNIYRKLEVESRAHAVAVALRRGLLK
jgi:DNA-binding NarL/FixJ family response regulator